MSEAAKSLGTALAPWVELRTPEGLLASVLVLGVPASLWVHRFVETPLRTRVRAALAPWVEGPRREEAKPVVSGT
ncbi:hypothetical protein ACLEPN_36000 [Myxococcus sp. 1LA]